jgi:hypothetical protein
MPPLAAVQVTSAGVTAYSDFENSTKLSTIAFTSETQVTFSKGNNDPIRLCNVADPSADYDAVNKRYVNATAQGLYVKEPVRVVSMTAKTLATAFAAAEVIDGVTLVADDRILVAAQAVASENGIYVVTATAPTRALDLAATTKASGAYVFVDQGTTYKDRAYVCITDKDSSVVGTNDLEWVQFSARSSAMAGLGLVVGSASELDVNVDNSTIEIASDVVQVKDLGITNAKIAAATIENGKLYLSTDTTNSTSKSTGALIVAGGVGIGLDTHIGGHAQVEGFLQTTATTDSTSKTTGALIVDGGAGIAKSVFIGVNADVVGDLHAATVHATADTNSTSTTTGALIVTGGAGIALDTHIGGHTQVTGFLQTLDTTDSSSKTTGALIVDGGAGIAKSVFIGVNADVVGDAAPATSQTTGALIVTGGVGISGDMYCSNSYNMSDMNLKEDIVTLSDAMSVVNAMRGCTFRWNHHPHNDEVGTAGKECVGVIAQEVVQAGASLAVSVNKETNLHAVDYTKLVPYLIEACKEMHGEMNMLKRRCEELEVSMSKRSKH